jgi:hypothetical protein
MGKPIPSSRSSESAPSSGPLLEERSLHRRKRACFLLMPLGASSRLPVLMALVERDIVVQLQERQEALSSASGWSV